MKNGLLVAILFLVCIGAKHKTIRIENRVWLDVSEEEYIYLCSKEKRMHFLKKGTFDYAIKMATKEGFCGQSALNDSLKPKSNRDWLNIAAYFMESDTIQCRIETPDPKIHLPINYVVKKHFDTTLNNIRYNALYLDIHVFNEIRKNALFISKKK